MDKEKVCVLPPQILQSIQYLRAIKGAEYANDFTIDILKYGIYGVPIENSYPEIDLESLIEQMDELKSSYLGAKKGGRKLTIDLEQVKQLHDAGLKTSQIAKELGVSPATINYHLKKMNSESII